jgi:predicted PurR-regulated permease PerM
LSDLVWLALTVLALVLCFLIVRPCVSSLAWATALAVIGWPLHRLIARRIPWPTPAAALSVITIALLLIVPSGLLIPSVVEEALGGYRLVRAQIESNAWDVALARHDWIGPVWEWLRHRVDLGDVLQQAGTLLTALGSLAVTTSFIGVIEFALTFFLPLLLLPRPRCDSGYCSRVVATVAFRGERHPPRRRRHDLRDGLWQGHGGHRSGSPWRRDVLVA